MTERNRTPARSEFGTRRIYYNNFAEHLQNSFNPNMFYPGLPNRWGDDEWRGCIDFVAACGFNVFEFWFVPRLFCREALTADDAAEFTRQMNAVIDHAHGRGLKVEFLCALATVGDRWKTLCPNDPAEWAEIRFLWESWLRRYPGIDIVGIFPGDPGACSRNGCDSGTFIDRSVDMACLVRRVLPGAEVELHTWGPPFFGWGNIEGPAGWKGEFVQSFQHTAWRFDPSRAEKAMRHLLCRLPDLPAPASVAINMGFNPDGNPDGGQDARPWIREIARTHPVYSWDFSLTEGENAVLPHWRFERLFRRRREERAGAPYAGGICFSMTPKLNQLTLFMAAQSFIQPDADPADIASGFLERVFGPGGRELASLLPLFEVIRDWGNYQECRLSRSDYHMQMRRLCDILESLDGQERDTYPVFPNPAVWRRELLFFAELFADLSGSMPDYDILHERYWRHIYAINDLLPDHVDPRPRQATVGLIRQFRQWKDAAEGSRFGR